MECVETFTPIPEETLEDKVYKLEQRISELESCLSSALNELNLYNPYNY